MRYFLHLLQYTCILAVVILLSCSIQPAKAQVFYVDPTAGYFLDDGLFDSLIIEQAIPVAVQNGSDAVSLRQNYPAYRNRFADLLMGLLQHRLMELRKRYEYNMPARYSIAYQKARAAYIAEIKKAIARALENPTAFYPLFNRNETDRILSFHSEIRVQTNGKLLVTENIRIYNGNGGDLSMNDDIKRGIVRDFPTKYLDSNGLWVHTGFELKAVYRLGSPESYITRSLSNGTRVLVGREDVLLEPGFHQYRLVYETSNQLIFHPNKDELYWNVNGNGWVFTADSISCSIYFPGGAKLKESDCYTGPFGASERNCRIFPVNDSTIRFYGTERFNAYEGLTIAVAIEKGLLVAPGNKEKWLALLQANYLVPVLVFFVLVLLAYYLRTWHKKGRDPDKGPIYPQFEPPAGLRPADTGYIREQSYGTHLFTASLVDAAVQKDLTIEVNKGTGLFSSTSYSFQHEKKTGKPGSNSLGYRHWYGFDINRIYGQEASRGKYNSTLKSLNDELQADLKSRFQATKSNKANLQAMFSLNRGYTWPGVVLILVSALLSIVFLATHYTLPLLIFAGTMVVLLLIIQLVFYKLMQAYTEKGRDIADHIEGFRMYLSATEQAVYNQLSPPGKTLELFEKYLPFAIALKVENEWASQFEEQIQSAIDRGYQPGYFSTRGFGRNFSMSGFTTGISSGLSGTISSASTPPSSGSGGSGGGGFSGGGGGGGGGGGW